ncbi:MAG: hypothetical protein NC231_13555 [Bacillus sp. (in: Bacteria)]|nr:hypothetical protein [Bacillus sp. (in: firmicutes)]MCM1425898.1 hypothetical protein [Eubacterium sp.]
MKVKSIHMLAGALFIVAGAVSLLDGALHARGSNIFIGICFVIVGCLYFKKKP